MQNVDRMNTCKKFEFVVTTTDGGEIYLHLLARKGFKVHDFFLRVGL